MNSIDLYCKCRKTGNEHYNKGNYKDAISIYSGFILNFDLRSTKTNSIKIQFGVLINNRAQCYIKLNKYHNALRDLNWILNTFKREPQHSLEWTTSPVHDSICDPDSISLCKKALFRRANIYLKLGNSSQAYGDYFSLTSQPFCQFEFAEKQKMKLGLLQHPSNQTLISCNKHTIKSNIFPVPSWIRIKPASFQPPLPPQATHSMICVGSEIYCMTGRDYASPNSEEIDIFVMKIKIHKDGSDYYYRWKQIEFPIEYIQAYNPYNNGVKVKTTIHKWNQKLILFGGFHPFKTLFVFCLKSKTWDLFPVKQMNFTLQFDDEDDKDYYDMDNHTAIVMNDKLFVYTFNHHEDHHLFCFST
eukprot:507930_1